MTHNQWVRAALMLALDILLHLYWEETSTSRPWVNEKYTASASEYSNLHRISQELSEVEDKGK